ncbi:MAG: four helix bundle protein [Candidatus Scalindua rubra]|uniref:Ribosomal protein n=1 Tax=Candidatus Scalindua brodae TaxID=237368 RepID=A0A0B0ENN3_9BACT|nr:MAG: ribosomal protein [Candidatus Scalindua brodae]MBZ0107098.1 four helix bundle protein [Candidatus Scalindua rubra]
MKITRFEDIESWQMARELTRQVYNISKSQKFSKDFGLKDQICRASVSVMSNIAEGFNSGSRAEFARFLSYSQRSCSEIQSQLYVALDQNYITEKFFDEIYTLANSASSKIGGFIKYLKQQKTKNQ